MCRFPQTCLRPVHTQSKMDEFPQSVCTNAVPFACAWDTGLINNHATHSNALIRKKMEKGFCVNDHPASSSSSLCNDCNCMISSSLDKGQGHAGKLHDFAMGCTWKELESTNDVYCKHCFWRGQSYDALTCKHKQRTPHVLC